MNTAFIYRASYGLNIALAAAALFLILREPDLAQAITATAPHPTARAQPLNALQDSARYMESASAAEQRRWLVDRLRAMGVPLRVLGRLVQEDLDMRWNRYAAEVTKRTHGDLATMDALQLQIDLSTDADMRAALGEEAFRQWDQQNMLREANEGGMRLTASETNAAYVLWKNLKKRELEIKQAKLRAEMDQVDIGDALDKALVEFEQQMKALVGDERYALSQRTEEGATMSDLRQDLSSSSPTDAQFRELLKTQRRWNEIRSEIDLEFRGDESSPAYAAQLQALDHARDYEYRQVLGPEVFDALQKERHPSYTTMKKHAGIWGLDDHKIESVYGSIKYYEKTVQDYRAQALAFESQGQRVDWAAVEKNLQQFSVQTQQALLGYLGSDSFNTMQRNGVFQIIENKSPQGAPLKPENRGDRG